MRMCVQEMLGGCYGDGTARRTNRRHDITHKLWNVKRLAREETLLQNITEAAIGAVKGRGLSRNVITGTNS